jgi:hypothetical protein
MASTLVSAPATEAVILPNRPLFMVDRGFQRRKKNSRYDTTPEPWTASSRPSRVPDITISVASKARNAKKQTIDRERKTGPGGKTGPTQGKEKVVHQKQLSSRLGKDDDSTSNDSKSLELRQVPSGASTALYSLVNSELSSFLKFTTYCT